VVGELRSSQILITLSGFEPLLHSFSANPSPLIALAIEGGSALVFRSRVFLTIMNRMEQQSLKHPARATTWQLPRMELRFGPVPVVMGIVNVTPDSFSDGGQHFDPARAVDFSLQLVEQGAGILDIGGESTRPYSTAVDAAEELRRVLPVIQALAKQTTIPLSIDTSKPDVARAALDAGAQIINDVSGFRDPELLRLAAESGAAVCAMHMQGTPQTMQDRPEYGDVVQEIHDYLFQCREMLLAAGIAQERICLDPGIGFGKTHGHNLTLMANCYRFHDLGCPLLVGHSRKGFIAKILNDKERSRDAGSIGAACALAAQGVQIIRVHDVRGTVDALRLFVACGGA
jgi:dihydropteroate synthase